MAVGIARDGIPVFVRAYGVRDVASHQPLRVDTPFEIGSVSKQFTAALALELVRQGRLSLDDRLAQYVPAYTRAANVTVRELLQQTSGIPDTQSFARLRNSADEDATEALVAVLNREPLVFAPGSGWGYSNSNYILLARIIEVVSGQPFDAELRDRILQPLSLDTTDTMGGRLIAATGYQSGAPLPSPAPSMDPARVRGAGGIVSTVEDLLRWGHALQSGQVVSAVDYEAMTTPPRFSDGTTPAYGMGLAVDRVGGIRRIWHDGQTFGDVAFSATYPEHSLQIVVLANRSDVDVDEVASTIENIVLRPAATVATPLEDPYSIYFAAIDAMRALYVPPFIQFDVALHAEHRAHSLGGAAYREIERVDDAMTRAEGLRPDGSRSGDVKVFHEMIAPTAFLGTPTTLTAPRESVVPRIDSAAPDLKVIGSVRISHYTIVREPDENANGCQDAYHLRLTPKSDPSYYNLRELWIDRTTRVICRGVLLARVYIVVPTYVSVTENLDMAGYVQSWTLHGTGHTPLGPYTADVQGRISDIRTDVPALNPNLLKP